MRLRPLKALLAIPLVWAVYLVSANALLVSGKLARLVSDAPEHVLLTYRHAYTIVPGVVRLTGLSLRIQDTTVQIFFTLDRATVALSLPALYLAHELRVGALDAEGLAFRMRLKRFANDVQRKHWASLPSIPGLPAFVRAPGPPPPPAPHPWRVRLDNVRVANVRELWIDEFRYQGEARVDGRFFLVPAREADVGPARLRLDGGRLDIAGVASLDALHADIDVRVRPFLRAQVEGLHIFDFTTASVKGSARVDSMRFLDYYLAGASWLRFARGAGRLALDLGIDAATFRPGSRVAFRSSDLEARFHSQRIRGAGQGSWSVDEKGGRGTLRVDLARFRVASPERGALVSGPRLSLTATTPDLRLESLFSRLAIRLSVPDARIASLRYFNAYVPKSSRLLFQGGAGRISGELRAFLPDHRGDQGTLVVEVPRAAVEYSPFQITGAIRAAVRLGRGSTAKREFDLSGTRLSLTDVVATEGPLPSQGAERWWGEVLVDRGDVTVGRPLSLAGRISLHARDARPLLEVFDPEHGIPGIVRAFLPFHGLEASARLAVSDDRLSLSALHARGGANELDGWLEGNRSDRRGRLLVQYGPLAAGLELHGDTAKLRLQDAIRWYRTAPRDAE